jgi:hypothetical protein
VTAMHTGRGRHRTDVRVSRASDRSTPSSWYAFCECGWVGKSMSSHGDAREDADDHTNYMAGE